MIYAEQLGMTEQHLQTSKGFIRRADDNTSDIKALNRSIFIPAITFDKSKKRAEQDAKMARRYEEDKASRDATNAQIMATHDRIAQATGRNNRDGPPDDDDDEGLSGGGRYNQKQMAARKAQWAKYQSRDDDEEDDAMENEISNNLDELSLGIGRIKALAHAQGDIVNRQNEQLKKLHSTVDDVDRKLVNSTDRVSRSVQSKTSNSFFFYRCAEFKFGASIHYINPIRESGF
jgi:hypothetical protein